MNKHTLKPGWKLVKFGDIAQNVTVRVDPAKANSDIYVGLEHLDPSTLHLRQWGHPSDVTGQKLEFKKGDVIFGRRRAYQRKLAIAEFDGICSAHAMVVRAKPKVILPEFLPFFLQSDMFMERAIEISVGSLSPTINWKTLCIQEFPLPPLEEQKRIAEILWAADNAFEYNISLKQTAQKLYLATIEHRLFDKANKDVKVEELATINSATLSESRTPPDYRFKYLDIGTVIAPKTIGELSCYSFSDAPSRARRVVEDHDILLSTVRPNLKSFVRVEKLKEVIIASTGFVVLSPKSRAIGSILFHAFFSKRFEDFCEARVTGTSYPAISAKDIGEFKICISKNDEAVTATAKAIDAIDEAIANIDFNISQLDALKKVLAKKTLSEDAYAQQKGLLRRQAHLPQLLHPKRMADE